MQCIFYDKFLYKQIPCLLVTNELYKITNDFDRKFYVHVEFDPSKFEEFNTSRAELLRYSKEKIKLIDIYPARSQKEIDYAINCIPNLLTNNHSSDELDRFESIIDMLTENDITRELFYNLCEFITYELLFMYCTTDEKSFFMILSASQLSEQPEVILIPQIIRMLKRIFTKYLETPYDVIKIMNYRRFSGFDSELPVRISLTNLKYNCNYLIV